MNLGSESFFFPFVSSKGSSLHRLSLLSCCFSLTAAAVDCSREEMYREGQEVAKLESAVLTLWAHCLVHLSQTNTKTKHKKKNKEQETTHMFFFFILLAPTMYHIHEGIARRNFQVSKFASFWSVLLLLSSSVAHFHSPCLCALLSSRLLLLLFAPCCSRKQACE